MASRSRPEHSKRPPSRFAHSKKGQYFSFDAIVASVIFILAITLLAGHWFALRAQIDDRSDYLYAEGFRLSEAFLGPGDPPLWYSSLDYVRAAQRAGLSVNGSLPIELNATTLRGVRYYLNPSLSGDASIYNASRALLGTAVNYWVEINTTADSYPGDQNFTFGLPFAYYRPTEIARVRRSVVVRLPDPNGRAYAGNMTIYLWSNRTRG